MPKEPMESKQARVCASVFTLTGSSQNAEGIWTRTLPVFQCSGLDRCPGTHAGDLDALVLTVEERQRAWPPHERMLGGYCECEEADPRCC